MQARRAAVAGTVAIAAAVGAFLLVPEHRIVGSNRVAPLHRRVSDLGGESRRACQTIPSVPDGAGSVRVRAAAGSVAEVGAVGGDPSDFGPIADLRVTIERSARSGELRHRPGPGQRDHRDPALAETSTRTDARLCISSESAGRSRSSAS